MPSLKLLLWTPYDDHSELLSYNFLKHGFTVAEAKRVKDIVQQLAIYEPDVVLIGSLDEKKGKKILKKLSSLTMKNYQLVVLTTQDSAALEGLEPDSIAPDLVIHVPAKPTEIVSQVSAMFAS